MAIVAIGLKVILSLIGTFLVIAGVINLLKAVLTKDDRTRQENNVKYFYSTLIIAIGIVLCVICPFVESFIIAP